MSVTSSSYQEELLSAWRESGITNFEDFLDTATALDIMKDHEKSLGSLLWAVNMREMETKGMVVFTKYKDLIEKLLTDNTNDWSYSWGPFSE